MDDPASKREALEKLYQKAFSPDEYVRTYYGHLDQEVEFFLQNLHDFFSRLDEGCIPVDLQQFRKSSFRNWKLFSSQDFSDNFTRLLYRTDLISFDERRVLEIGAGPTVISMISASGWCQNITASDFLPQNRDRIHHWLTIDTNYQEDVWKPFFQYVANLEHKSIDVLVDRVRRAIKAVLPCNVFFDRPLISQRQVSPSASGTAPAAPEGASADAVVGDDRFDVIISTLCLEFAAVSLEEYRTAVRNVAALLRPSGYLILQGALGNTHYKVGESQLFPSLCLGPSDAKEAITAAGCRLIDWKELPRCCPPDVKPADHSACFYCLIQNIPLK